MTNFYFFNPKIFLCLLTCSPKSSKCGELTIVIGVRQESLHGVFTGQVFYVDKVINTLKMAVVDG